MKGRSREMSREAGISRTVFKNFIQFSFTQCAFYYPY